MCKRFGCKVVIIFGGILVGVGFLLLFFVDSIFWMYVMYLFLFGLGFSMCYVLFVFVFSGYFLKNLVVVNGIGLVGVGVGMILFVFVFSFLFDNYYWCDVLCIFSVILIFFVISGLIYYLVLVLMEFSDVEEY